MHSHARPNGASPCNAAEAEGQARAPALLPGGIFPCSVQQVMSRR